MNVVLPEPAIPTQTMATGASAPTFDELVALMSMLQIWSFERDTGQVKAGLEVGTRWT